MVAAERPFLDALPNTSRHLLAVAETPAGRSGVVRAAARHLRGGGAVLTFPGGRIEPDPAVLAPGLTVVPVVVSGVISPMALRVPLTRLRRRKRDREWLAATLQMLTPALRDVDASVEFGRPIYAGAGGGIGEAVIEATRRLMENEQTA